MRVFVVSGLLLLALLATGCFPWFDRTEQRLNEIAFETHAQSARQYELASEIALIRAMLESEGLSTDEQRAALLSRLRSLEVAVEQMSARGQEQEQLMRRMSAALDQLARGELPALPVPAAADSAGSVGSVVAQPPAVELAADSPPELVLYDAATRDFRRGNYILARAGFEELAHSYPNSQLADNATYWLGETLYAEADFAAALVRYQEVIELYPLSDVLPAAMLKSAYCHLEMENPDAAVAAFERVIMEFPDSDEAENAEHRLSSLGRAQ